MKTYYEIVGTKTYRQLTLVEKEAIQDRQTELVQLWQDESLPEKQELIFDELYDSFKGLVKAMAYKKSEQSYTVDMDDFEGLINLTLVESLLSFDRTLNKPFQPVFIMNVNNAVKMMYRQKGYDLHDTTYSSAKQRLDADGGLLSDGSKVDVSEKQLSSQATLTVTSQVDFTMEVEHSMVTEKILSGLFGMDEIKKTIVHMHLQGFKRNEIVSAIAEEGKSSDSLAKKVNRTLSKFKDAYALVHESAMA
ncbi:hypothetical protein [Priestia megaterium]|uniref:hypothetical protein n=1 Tax=Priestia megaterium TaxID=1404 RepID=UPI00285CF218|nr:hypothetical protein [Priestia megaterium]MDR7207618.1 hypothetical protein [Priestia megaterium]